MAVLSLLEAAEQVAASKIDVWRAIQEGALPAEKTSDGGYAIDPVDLFRVFERKQPEPQAPAAPDAVGGDKTDEARGDKADEAAEPAAQEDLSVAFAALQAELKHLLGSAGAAPWREDEQRTEPEPRPSDGAEERPHLESDPADGQAKAGAVIAERAAPPDEPMPKAETRRPWWRRLRN